MSDTTTTTKGAAQARYEHLAAVRSPYVERARECAAVTIPALFPPEGSNSDDLPRPYTSVGARGVNNLASKLLLALLPPGSSFFKLSVADSVVEELAALSPDADIRGQINSDLSRVEQRVVRRVESNGSRIQVYESLRQILVAGNVLLHVGKGGTIRFFRLDSYVVVRDGMGNPLEVIVMEKLDRETVPENIRDLVEPAKRDEHGTVENAEVVVYTHIRLVKNRWKVHQEVEGQEVPKSYSTYPKDRLPWIPLRFARPSSEDYGRSYVEEYIGDHASLESVTKSILDFSGAAARILYLVKPDSQTDPDVLVNAASGDVVPGYPDDVGTLQFDKFADFQVAHVVATGIESRLAAAYLLNSTVQRQAERVTAEEIRYVANELEQALGGIYSILGQEFQLPLVNLLMSQMTRDGDLPSLPKDTVRPEVTTGLDALGRSSDLAKQDILLQGIAEKFGPEAVAEWVNVGAYITRRATALGIEIEGLVRSEDEVAQARQQATQVQLVQALGPEAMRQQAAMQQSPATQQNVG